MGFGNRLMYLICRKSYLYGLIESLTNLMKKYLLTCLLLTACLLVSAQSPQIKWGKSYKNSRRITLEGIIGKDATGVYNLNLKYGLITYLLIEHLDKDLNFLKKESIALRYDKKSMDFEKILLRNGELLLFSSLNDPRQKIKQLYVQHVNKETLMPKGDFKKVATINYEESNRRNSGDFAFEESRDFSKLLIYYTLPSKKKENETLGFHVFDQSNQEIWSKQLTLPLRDQSVEIEDHIIDNEGNVHLLGKNYLDLTNKQSRSLEGSGYNYELLSFYEKGTRDQRHVINLTGKYITDIKVAVNVEKEIVCAGFYSEKSAHSIAGTFFLKINAQTSGVLKESYKAFGSNFLNENRTEVQTKKSNKKLDPENTPELFRYDLRDVILTGEGGAILVGEQYYVRERTDTYMDSNGNWTTRTVYTYFYNDLIVVKINPEGSIAWANKIPKRQITSNDGGYFSSFHLSITDHHLYFIFNDHIKNILKPQEGIARNFTGGKNGAVALVALDDQGQYTRQQLFKTKDMAVIIRPKKCIQIPGSNETILFGQRRKLNQFGSLTFK